MRGEDQQQNHIFSYCLPRCACGTIIRWGNLLVENRNGLIVKAEVFAANGTAVAECRHLGVTPHVAQNLGRRGGSAIDGLAHIRRAHRL